MVAQVVTKEVLEEEKQQVQLERQRHVEQRCGVHSERGCRYSEALRRRALERILRNCSGGVLPSLCSCHPEINLANPKSLDLWRSCCNNCPYYRNETLFLRDLQVHLKALNC